jgi:Spy/CpxP family protein refolding chaperone
MKLRLVLVVIALLVAGAVVVGCGGDDNNDGGGDSAANTQSTDTGGGGSGGGTSTEDSGGGSNPSNPQIQQAVDACKQQIQAQPGISDSVKSDLTKICEKAASGDEQAVRDATKQVCTKLVEANVPEGPARDQALSACNQAGQGP